jgi:hypothetical protein
MLQGDCGGCEYRRPVTRSIEIKITQFIALMFFSTLVVTGQERFSESQCVRRWVEEVDRPFRIKRATAIKRCRAISVRINTLSKQILGKWQLTGNRWRKETLDFSSNGTVRHIWYDAETRKSGNTVAGWAIVNPYGTPGSEVIQFSDLSYVKAIKILGATMTIVDAPASYTHVERWRRIR